MQDDPLQTTSDHEKTKIDSPQKYVVVSQKSVSTYDSDLTGGSKRSTEEEELRSLSTTPRYSHEDLGRIVSPPHSSDFSSETDQDRNEIDDTLSAREVYLKSRTSQFTHHTLLPVPVSDKDSVYSQQSQKTQSEKAWAKPVHPPYKVSYVNQELANTGLRHKTYDISSTSSIKSVKESDQKVYKSSVYSEKADTSFRHKPYDKDFSFSDKLSLKSHVTSTKLSVKSYVKSTATAPELLTQRARQEYQNKPNYTDHDFKKPHKPLLRRPDHRIPPASIGSGYGQLRPSAGIDYSRLRAEELMQMRMSNVDANLQDIMMDAENTHRDLLNEHDHRRMLENQLQEIDEERKELNTKLATLRVKLGVANSNFNVGKTECDQMRQKYQETQIQKARLEERIQACTKELEKLKDPKNPDSNVNMKKVVLNDRKEIRRLRTELEGVRSERSEIQKQIQDKDEKIKMLNIYIGEAKDQLEECSRDYEVVKISVTGERKKREEVEEMYSELLKDKNEFDQKMAEIQSHLDVAISGTNGVHKQSEHYREKEHALLSKIEVVEKKLRDTLTEVEQQKNRAMPFRTATSIKHHQYRMTTSGWVTDTTPHVIVTTNTNASIAASGYLGKTVVSTKPAKSVPSRKVVSKVTPRSKGSSLPDKK